MSGSSKLTTRFLKVCEMGIVAVLGHSQGIKNGHFIVSVFIFSKWSGRHDYSLRSPARGCLALLDITLALFRRPRVRLCLRPNMLLRLFSSYRSLHYKKSGIKPLLFIMIGATWLLPTVARKGLSCIARHYVGTFSAVSHPPVPPSEHASSPVLIIPLTSL